MENRVTELEIRLTHLEDTIEQLQVSLLEKKIKASQSSPVAHESEETPPPHY